MIIGITGDVLEISCKIWQKMWIIISRSFWADVVNLNVSTIFGYPVYIFVFLNYEFNALLL